MNLGRVTSASWRSRRARRMVAGCAAALALLVNGGILGAAEDGRVNINTASVTELTELPGVGPAKAAAIVEERERKPFASVNDLTRVSGIGDRMLEQLRDRISVGGVDARPGADAAGGADKKAGAKER
jgi:competence protein ComEA